jgi:hypothetical protein
MLDLILHAVHIIAMSVNIRRIKHAISFAWLLAVDVFYCWKFL